MAISDWVKIGIAAATLLGILCREAIEVYVQVHKTQIELRDIELRLGRIEDRKKLH